MAGPTLVNVGGVVNPYQDLQNAVSGVGQIYRGYEEDARKQAAFKAQEDERNRVKSMREFATNYDARVGDDFRGVSAGIQPLAQQAEAQAMQRWRSTNPTATADQQAAFELEIKNARRSLASAEDVAASVTQDYMKAGFAPDEAEAYGRQAAVGYNSRGAALASAQAQAAAADKLNETKSQRLLDLYRIEQQGDSADTRMLLALSGGVGKASSGKSAGANSQSGGLIDPKKAEAFETFIVDKIGSRDAKAALTNIEGGLSAYNARAKLNGRPTLSFEQAQAAAMSNLSRGSLDNDALFKDKADFAAILTEQYGPADAVPAGTGVGGAGSLAERQALITGNRSPLSASDRATILNLAPTVINPEQVARQQVAAAYARLFPEAAQANSAVVEKALDPMKRTRTSTGNQTTTAGVGTKYRPTAAPALTGDATRGSKRTDLTTGANDGTPAGVPSSPARQEITPARALAEEIVAYQNSGTSGDIDLPRVLQTLQERNPAMYNSVIREKADLESLDRNIKALENRTTSLQTRLGNQNMLALSTDTPRPVLTGSPMAFLPEVSPYRKFLKEQENLKVMQQQLSELRQRKPVVNPNTPQDFTRLRSMLTY